MRIDYAPYVRSWSGLIKTLIQLMLKEGENSVEIPEVGVVVLHRRAKTLTIHLEQIDESVEQVLQPHDP